MSRVEPREREKSIIRKVALRPRSVSGNEIAPDKHKQQKEKNTHTHFTQAKIFKYLV